MLIERASTYEEIYARFISGDAQLVNAIQEFIRARLARHECPRDMVFVDFLPMTATGKILRRELRQRQIVKTC